MPLMKNSGCYANSRSLATKIDLLKGLAGTEILKLHVIAEAVRLNSNDFSIDFEIKYSTYNLFHVSACG